MHVEPAYLNICVCKSIQCPVLRHQKLIKYVISSEGYKFITRYPGQMFQPINQTVNTSIMLTEY